MGIEGIKTYSGQGESKLRQVASEAGLMPLVSAFTEVLQDLHEQESDEGGGYFREFIPIMVADVLATDSKLGVGEEIYKELKVKTAEGDSYGKTI